MQEQFLKFYLDLWSAYASQNCFKSVDETHIKSDIDNELNELVHLGGFIKSHYKLLRDVLSSEAGHSITYNRLTVMTKKLLLTNGVSYAMHSAQSYCLVQLFFDFMCILYSKDHPNDEFRILTSAERILKSKLCEQSLLNDKHYNVSNSIFQLNKNRLKSENSRKRKHDHQNRNVSTDFANDKFINTADDINNFGNIELSSHDSINDSDYTSESDTSDSSSDKDSQDNSSSESEHDISNSFSDERHYFKQYENANGNANVKVSNNQATVFSNMPNLLKLSLQNSTSAIAQRRSSSMANRPSVNSSKLVRVESIDGSKIDCIPKSTEPTIAASIDQAETCAVTNLNRINSPLVKTRSVEHNNDRMTIGETLFDNLSQDLFNDTTKLSNSNDDDEHQQTLKLLRYFCENVYPQYQLFIDQLLNILIDFVSANNKFISLIEYHARVCCFGIRKFHEKFSISNSPFNSCLLEGEVILYLCMLDKYLGQTLNLSDQIANSTFTLLFSAFLQCIKNSRVNFDRELDEFGHCFQAFLQNANNTIGLKRTLSHIEFENMLTKQLAKRKWDSDDQRLRSLSNTLHFTLCTYKLQSIQLMKLIVKLLNATNKYLEYNSSLYIIRVPGQLTNPELTRLFTHCNLLTNKENIVESNIKFLLEIDQHLKTFTSDKTLANLLIPEQLFNKIGDNICHKLIEGTNVDFCFDNGSINIVLMSILWSLISSKLYVFNDNVSYVFGPLLRLTVIAAHRALKDPSAKNKNLLKLVTNLVIYWLKAELQINGYTLDLLEQFFCGFADDSSKLPLFISECSFQTHDFSRYNLCKYRSMSYSLFQSDPSNEAFNYLESYFQFDSSIINDLPTLANLWTHMLQYIICFPQRYLVLLGKLLSAFSQTEDIKLLDLTMNSMISYYQSINRQILTLLHFKYNEYAFNSKITPAFCSELTNEQYKLNSYTAQVFYKKNYFSESDLITCLENLISSLGTFYMAINLYEGANSYEDVFKAALFTVKCTVNLYCRMEAETKFFWSFKIKKIMYELEQKINKLATVYDNIPLLIDKIQSHYNIFFQKNKNQEKTVNKYQTKDEIEAFIDYEFEDDCCSPSISDIPSVRSDVLSFIVASLYKGFFN